LEEEIGEYDQGRGHLCGLVGILRLTDSAPPVDRELLLRMRDTMAHRGPDGTGAWTAEDGTIGLAFRRLAIIDLSAEANQPMCNEDGTLRVVYNGEIYNHADLRRELQALGGHVWKTDHSDTEVILHAFEQWGIDCVQKFRGMFAIALWDGRRRDLWLVRDRIGVKPLYYSLHHGQLAFASEIKALLEDSRQERVLDEESLYHYLSFLTTPAPRTLFRGIRKLAAGTWIRVDESGVLQEHRYWDVWDHAGPLGTDSEDQIAERVLAELRTAVQLRKVSDVPVGVFLSGGIDSSTNAALFSEGERTTVKTFSVGYSGDYKSYRNEFQFARLMAKQVGADHHERLLNMQDLIDFLPRMAHLQDEPLADPVCFPVHHVSALAREHGVVVCQVGEGADELFCGYPSWKRMLDLQQLDDLPVPRAAKRLVSLSFRMTGQADRREYEFLRRGIADLPVFWSGADALTEAQKARLLSPRVRRSLAGLTSYDVIRPIRERFEARAWDTAHLNWMSYADLNIRLPELLLMRVDKMSMGVSLEGRVPFLDHKFVELAMSIPASMKVKNGTLKYILKKAVRGVIPDELIDRPKQGFGVPVYEWLFEGLGDTARCAIDDLCSRTDIFDREQALRLVDEHRGLPTWILLNLALWWKHFIEGERLAEG
jgi:asparagine synthase (glutamine-hydrolysing)